MPRRVNVGVIVLAALLLVLAAIVVPRLVPHAPDPASVRASRMIYSSELKHRHLFGGRVRRMLAAAQYDRLEALADSVRSTGATFPSGMPVIDSFFGRGFAEVDDEGDAEQWSSHLSGLRAWLDARPQSSTAAIALAHGLMGRARACGDASMGRDARRIAFESGMSEADRILGQCPYEAKTRADWFAAEVEALNGMGDDARYRATAAAALDSFPRVLFLYLSMASHLMPRAYGKPGDWETFADTCGRSLPDSLRDEFYARIVADQDHVVANVFKASPQLSWARVRNGLAVWSRQCPLSVQPNSALALLAWEHGDPMEARRALAAIGDTIEVDVWQDPSMYWIVDAWARPEGPMAALPPKR
ncbi:MAG TPA: hypothetical protein VL332_11555 [Candidatus Saccharimonadaceae bacterium]|jgi:hypothetical protein|nr:hypothetical protein [Candidatus Saccharimonadaceae bacterium]